MSTVDNPRQSPITRAYLDAKAVIGGLPETERERSLFEALQASLQTQYDPDLHKKCEQDEEDLRWEISKLEAELDELKAAVEKRVGALPEPLADIDSARAIILDRGFTEIAGSVATFQAKAEDLKRETTAVLRDLADEVEAWRKLFNGDDE